MEKDELTYQIIGAAMEVHSVLGCGFTEFIYQDALEIEFQKRNIPYQREATVAVEYKGRKLSHFYRADFICFDCIVVELKAVEGLELAHKLQVINYLKAAHLTKGLLFNFGEPSLKYKRLANNFDKGFNEDEND